MKEDIKYWFWQIILLPVLITMYVIFSIELLIEVPVKAMLIKKGLEFHKAEKLAEEIAKTVLVWIIAIFTWIIAFKILSK